MVFGFLPYKPLKAVHSVAIKSFAFGILGLLLVSCAQGEAPPRVLAPTLEFECHSATAHRCIDPGEPKPVYAGLLKDRTKDCDSYLAATNSVNFALSFEASGLTTTSWDGSFLTGSISSWVDNTGFPLTYIDNDYYLMCLYIDMDGDGILDATEPVGQGVIHPVGYNQPISDWSPH